MDVKETNFINMVGVRPSQGAGPIPVGKIPDGGTQILKRRTIENAVSTIHTVTVGKTLYLSSVIISVRNTSGGPGNILVRIKDDENGVVTYLVYTVSEDDKYICTPMAFLPPLELAAGWYIEGSSPAANIILIISIHGYEV